MTFDLKKHELVASISEGIEKLTKSRAHLFCDFDCTITQLEEVLYLLINDYNKLVKSKPIEDLFSLTNVLSDENANIEECTQLLADISNIFFDIKERAELCLAMLKKAS